MTYKYDEKDKEKHRQYYLNNKEKFSLKAKERYLKNSDKIKDRVKKRYYEKQDDILKQQAKYYQEHKKEIGEVQKIWVSKNKDKVNRIKAKYREAHREEIKKASLEYNKAHWDQCLANKHKWRAKNPHKLKEEKLKARFGITLDQFNKLIKQQKNHCGICNSEFNIEKPNSINGICVDHDHTNQKVRGLLCRICNSGIGGLNDDPVFLEKAILWIKNRGPTHIKKIKSKKVVVQISRKRKSELKRKYDMSVEDFNTLILIQENKCGICGKNITKRNNIDHCHDETQKIRGVLCPLCNTSIGLLKEDTEIMFKAINWLKRSIECA